MTHEHGARGTEDLEPWEEELRRRCTPAVIDYVKCLGRTYAGGRGGQCGKTVKKDGLCGRCGGGSGPAHGLVTGRVPKAKWKAFGISEADVQRLREGEGAAGLKTAGGQLCPRACPPRIGSIRQQRWRGSGGVTACGAGGCSPNVCGGEPGFGWCRRPWRGSFPCQRKRSSPSLTEAAARCWRKDWSRRRRGTGSSSGGCVCSFGKYWR